MVTFPATCFFSVIDRNVFETTQKKLSQFGQKYRVMNGVVASFDTTVRQMTNVSPKKQQPATSVALWKNLTKISG